jgi:peptide/nickel transport system permease protein
MIKTKIIKTIKNMQKKISNLYYHPIYEAFKMRTSILSLSLIIIMLLGSFLAEWIAPYDPRATSFQPFQPPSWDHLFGTDDLGRDLFSRVIYGIRTSVIIGLSAAIIAMFIGLLAGITSGYIGGLVDDIIMRITDTFQVIPRLVLAIVATAFLGPNIFNVILIIGGLSWPRTARVVRSIAIALRERPFIEAAKAVGATRSRIMIKHVLPHVLPMTLTVMGYEIAVAILIEAGLGFLGLSDPQLESIGKILHDGQRYFLSGWWIALIPGTILSMLIISINILMDNISSIINPAILLTTHIKNETKGK